jgi:hypothetical protein
MLENSDAEGIDTEPISSHPEFVGHDRGRVARTAVSEQGDQRRGGAADQCDPYERVNGDVPAVEVHRPISSASGEPEWIINLRR